jgi:hypothetical protein
MISMDSKLVSLQKRISFTLLQKIEHDEISVERASEVAKQVLNIIPKSLADDKVELAIPKLEAIPELKGIAFGL